MWILWLLLAVICLLIVCLCLPLDFVFDIDTFTGSKFKSRFIWLFGWVKVDLKHKAKTSEKTAHRQIHAPGSQKVPDISTIFEILKTRGLWRQIWIFIKGLFKVTNIRELTVDFRLGLEDPLDSSLLFMFAMPINYLLSLTQHRIKITPIYSGELYLGLASRGQVRVFPIQVIACAFRLIFSLPAIKIGWRMVRGQWKNRK